MTGTPAASTAAGTPASGTATLVRTVAVLGPRDSAVPAVAGALTGAAGDGLRVLTDARPEDGPDVAVLVVDAVCPIRPDDLEVARGVAARLPLLVALAGRAGSCEPDALAETVDVTTRRLADAGVRTPVHVVDEASPGAGAALLDALAALPARPDGTPGPAPATSPAGTTAGATTGATSDARPAPQATVDWLLARRTEAITSRSQALRQDVQALRIEAVQDLHRALRDLGGRAREELGAAPRGELAELVRALSDDADAAVAGAIARTDARTDTLVARHLGAAAPTTPRVPAPSGAIRPGPAPRHRAEEALVLVMGAAGGTGVGRMILAPLADLPVLGALLVPLALLAGIALGWTTVEVRRTQTLRGHMIAVVTDRLAGIRAEAEHSLGARVLAAESTITDGFVHDPGPRVADLERRIRRHRLGATTSPGSHEP